jgi:hypothetical protein
MMMLPFNEIDCTHRTLFKPNNEVEDENRTHQQALRCAHRGGEGACPLVADRNGWQGNAALDNSYTQKRRNTSCRSLDTRSLTSAWHNLIQKHGRSRESRAVTVDNASQAVANAQDLGVKWHRTSASSRLKQYLNSPPDYWRRSLAQCQML